MKITPTTAQKRKITSAFKLLSLKYKRKVYRMDDWCLRFSYRGSYFDYWPTTGRWIYSRGERRRSCMSNTRYHIAEDVKSLMAALDEFCDWLILSKPSKGEI